MAEKEEKRKKIDKQKEMFLKILGQQERQYFKEHKTTTGPARTLQQGLARCVSHCCTLQEERPWHHAPGSSECHTTG